MNATFQLAFSILNPYTLFGIPNKMSRKKKTPDHIVNMLQRHADNVEHHEEMIQVKLTVPIENQAQHVRQNTVEQMIGRIEGMNTMVEEALHAYGCYRGFTYRARPKTIDGTTVRVFVGPNHPEFKEYRRTYHIG